MDKYENFSLEDFLQDEFFRKSIKEPYSKEAESLDRWLNDHVEMQPVVEEARNLLLALEPKASALPDAFYLDLKTRIDQTIAAGTKRRTKVLFVPAWFKVAAVFAGVSVAAALLFYSLSGKTAITRYSSEYGQTKKVVLPDGSIVVLNAKSYLEYRAKAGNSAREVWLSGEGFFYIRHLEDREKKPLPFVVHSNRVNVEVMGTQFNVNSNDSATTTVLLTNGKVRLSVTGREMVPINMRPEELASYNHTTRGVSVNRVSTDTYLSWMKHKYIFEKTTLQQISKVIGRYYGKPVVISDVGMAGKRMSGTLELQDEVTLIRTLSALLGVEVDNNNDQISIGSE